MRKNRLAACLAAVALLGLSACSDAGRAFVVASVDKYQQYHDDEAALAAMAPCAMSVAGYWRALTGGGPSERPLTRDDALLARDLLRLWEFRNDDEIQPTR
jgi:hypothetical protein